MAILFNNLVLISRHGPKFNIPPHKINHKANIFAIKKLKKFFVFSFNSVGSLKKSFKPGEIVIPDDYINFEPLTFFNKKIRHITPEISEKLRKTLIKILKKLKLKFHQKGTYCCVEGPRFSTRAESKFFRNFSDIIGMTLIFIFLNV